MRLCLLALFLAVGCVNLQPCASYLDEHLDASISDSEEISRLVSKEDPIRPLVERDYWRKVDRMKPWTSEFRRYAGPIVVDVPVDLRDNRNMLRENKLQEEFSAQVDSYKDWELGFKDSGFLGGLTGIAGAFTGTGLLGAVMTFLARRSKKRSEQETEGLRRVNYKLHGALDQVKTVAKDAVVAATQSDPEVRQSYRQREADIIADQQKLKAMLVGR